MIRLLDGFKICYMDCERIVSIKHWPDETNVFEPGYNAGIGEPHFPVPAPMNNADDFIWCMLVFGCTKQLFCACDPSCCTYPNC